MAGEIPGWPMVQRIYKLRLGRGFLFPFSAGLASIQLVIVKVSLLVS